MKSLIKSQTSSVEGFFIIFCYLPLLISWHVAEIYGILTFMKPIFYFLPLAGILTLFVFNFLNKETDLTLNLSGYYVIGLYILLVGVTVVLNDRPFYAQTFNRDVVIFSLPLLFFSFKLQFTNQQFNLVFLGAALCYLIWVRFNPGWVLLDTLLTTSYQSHVEYHFGCVAGIFVIYYFYKRNLLLLVASYIFLLLVHKRSNMLGIFAAIPLYYLFYKPFKLEKSKWATFIFLLLYYFSFFIIAMNLEYFGNKFLELQGRRDIDIDYFLTGRMILIEQLQPEVYSRGVLNYLFGNGPGQSEYFIWRTIAVHIYEGVTRPFLVHNDFLKLNFDIGLIGVILYFFTMYYLYAVSRLGVMMFLYTVPLFLVDNTIIYMYNILVAAIAARVMPAKDDVKIENVIVDYFNKTKNFILTISKEPVAK